MGITPDDYEYVFFESAMRYLDIMLPHDWRGREVLHQDPAYWAWFAKQWAIRDSNILRYWDKSVPELVRSGEKVSPIQPNEYPLRNYEVKEMHPPPIRYSKYKNRK